VIEPQKNKSDLSALISTGLLALSQFWAWWTVELRAMLPAAWQNALEAGNNKLFVALEDDELTLGVLDRDQLADLIIVSVGDESAQNFIREYCSEHLLNIHTAVLAVGRAQAVVKNLSLPGAVEENLEGMLIFEMDRHTPFSAENVYFTHRVVSRDRVAEKIAVELVVVPRRSAAAVMDRLAAVGITASSMVVRLQEIVLAAGDLVASANLLTHESKDRNRSEIRQNRRHLEFAVVVLTVLALLIPTVHNGLQKRSLQQDVDVAKVSATKAQDAQRQLHELVQPGEEFLRLRSSTPLAVAVLNEVTRILPDDTWLDRVEVNQGRVRLQGESEQAAVLLALIEDNNMFSDAKFSSTITRNARSERERFGLEASINEPEAP
jgi:general secretion pathway protein L